MRGYVYGCFVWYDTIPTENRPWGFEQVTPLGLCSRNQMWILDGKAALVRPGVSYEFGTTQNNPKNHKKKRNVVYTSLATSENDFVFRAPWKISGSPRDKHPPAITRLMVAAPVSTVV